MILFKNNNCHVQNLIQFIIKTWHILMTAVQFSLSLEAKPAGTITDYRYSPTGQYLAVADSEGYVYIYIKKDAKSFVKTSDFRADEGSIWSIAWADAKYGNIIGIGSFRNKVAIFQQSNNSWREIAYHELHQASVNWVDFAPCGLKLYAGSSDGHISILQLYHKAWKSHSFPVSDSAIAVFALQPLPLGEAVAEQNLEKVYPRIATVTKDQKIKIWAHQNQKLYNEKTQMFSQKGKTNSSGYCLAKQFATPKQTIRNILWRPSWGSMNESLNQISLITCSQEGLLKSIKLGVLTGEKDSTQNIWQCEYQIPRISQSLTGNLLTASTVNKNQHETLIFEQVSEDQWKIVKKGKI